MQYSEKIEFVKAQNVVADSRKGGKIHIYLYATWSSK